MHRLARRALWGLLLILLSLAIPAYASIGLTSFTATPGNRIVYVQWSTATEFNNSGFIIHRSLQENGAYAPVSPFIPAEGGGNIGSDYAYDDLDVVNGTSYYYKLEAIDNNNLSEFYGPISATPGNPFTPTPSRTATLTLIPTLTRTPTVTPTPTLPVGQPPTNTVPPTRTLTQIPSSTPIRTNTPQPALPTGTDLPTSTLGLTFTEEPLVHLTVVPSIGESTATLIPLPTITILFPTLPAPVGLRAAANASQTPDPADQPGVTRSALGRFGPLVFIAAIWLALGGLFYFLLHRSA